MALDAICSAVPVEMISTLATKETTKAAWDCIKTMRVGKPSAQKLRSEYEALAFRDGVSVEDFAMRLNTIVTQLSTLGDPEPDDKVVEKYLCVARPRFSQLALSMKHCSTSPLCPWRRSLDASRRLRTLASRRPRPYQVAAASSISPKKSGLNVTRKRNRRRRRAMAEATPVASAAAGKGADRKSVV